MKAKNKASYTASLWLQVALFIFTIVFLSWLISKPIKKFNTTDAFPTILYFTPKKIAEWGGSPTPVVVGLYMRDIPELDLVAGRFLTDLTIWFKFDPKLISLEQIGNFEFDRARILDKSPPVTRIAGNSLVARYNMRVEFSMDLNYKNFPLDDHRITMILTHYLFSPANIVFESSKSYLSINPEIKIAGWKFLDNEVKTGYISYTLDQHIQKNNIFNPRVIFSFNFSRIGIRHLVSIFVPIILIFFIALFTLSIDPFGVAAATITTLSVASITAAITHRFVIENLSPATGYLMISDNIFLLVLTLCCIIFLINFFSPNITKFYKNITVITLTFIVIGIFYWLISPLI